MQRIVAFVRHYRISVRLVYYPPSWNGIHPVVELVTTVYQTGVRLFKEAMAEIEAHIQRLPGLEKWFVEITPAVPWDASLFLSPLSITAEA